MHRLQPEEQAIAPVTPLIREQHKAHRLLRDLVVRIDEKTIIQVLQDVIRGKREVFWSRPEESSVLLNQGQDML